MELLKDYESKRTFALTPEPKPGPSGKGKELVFVVQKHAARALHYDLRLELDGVLKSWAVPKGPSMNPSVKRLAVMVEDHPLAYKDFEGLIPAGNYGAGSVIVWDRGFYHHPGWDESKENEELLREGLRKGDLKFVLAGEKLRGEFALVKTRMDEKSWLLLKKKDPFVVTTDILQEDRSVISRQRVEDVAAADRLPANTPKGTEPLGRKEAREGRDWPDGSLKPMHRGIQPMLATLAKEPFDHPDWVFEVKWDGYRAIAEVGKGPVALYSRKGLSFRQKFRPLVAELEKFDFQAQLDGEIVVVDEQGQPDFQLLQDYRTTGGGQLLYYVFDLLYLEGRDLTGLPLLKRKELLKSRLPASPKIKFSDHVPREGSLFFRVAKEKGLEGIVAKHSQSVYRMGERSRYWLKIKTRLTQEGVIVGFTEPAGSRRYFGALVLGAYAGEELVYIGHAGGGFRAAQLGEIHGKMAPLIRKKCPFKIEPPTKGPVTWIKPELVCEVLFQGWTREGLMRQPVFSRLREDKAARSVVRETVVPVNPEAGEGDGKEEAKGAQMGSTFSGTRQYQIIN